MLNILKKLSLKYGRKFDSVFLGILVVILILNQFLEKVVTGEVAISLSFVVFFIYLALIIDCVRSTNQESAQIIDCVRSINKKSDPQSACRVFSNQDDANLYLTEYVGSLPKEDSIRQATVVQYSSDQVRGFIQNLLNNEIKVELFLQHPDKAISELQRTKIIMRLNTYKDIYRNKPEQKKFLSFFLYEDIGTIRAIQLGKSIAIGSYTYETHKDKKKGLSIHGFDNPVFFFDSSSKLADTVNTSFDKIVEGLRNNSIFFTLEELIDEKVGDDIKALIKEER